MSMSGRVSIWPVIGGSGRVRENGPVYISEIALGMYEYTNIHAPFT